MKIKSISNQKKSVEFNEIGKVFSGTGDTKTVKFAILILKKLHDSDKETFFYSFRS